MEKIAGRPLLPSPVKQRCGVMYRACRLLPGLLVSSLNLAVMCCSLLVLLLGLLTSLHLDSLTSLVWMVLAWFTSPPAHSKQWLEQFLPQVGPTLAMLAAATALPATLGYLSSRTHSRLCLVLVSFPHSTADTHTVLAVGH